MTGTTRRARQAQPMPSCSPRALARRLAALPDSFTSHPAVAQLIDQLARDRRARRCWRSEVNTTGGHLDTAVIVLNQAWTDSCTVLSDAEGMAVRVFAARLALNEGARRRASAMRRHWRRNLRRYPDSRSAAPSGSPLHYLAELWHLPIMESFAGLPARLVSGDRSRCVSARVRRHLRYRRSAVPLSVVCDNEAHASAAREWLRYLAVHAWALRITVPPRVVLTVHPWKSDRPAWADAWPPPWRPVIEVLTCAVLTAAPPARVPVPVGEGQRARLTVAA